MFERFQATVAIAVFLVTYALIISEKIHRTVAALLGAVLLVVLGIMAPEKAVRAIDFNTIGLLVGMMIIVGITGKTGLFEYLGIKSAKLVRGEPVRLIAALSLVTAVLSALLDNVTTILFMLPVTFTIARRLEVSPLPFVVAEVIASNVGGTATLIGDPPNIMIGSATGLGFMDFIVNLTPVVVVVHVLTVFALQLAYRNELSTRIELQNDLAGMREQDEIKDLVLLRKCLVVLGLTMTGFVIHQYVHLESSVVALSGASLLLLITKEDPKDSIQEVEWSVIFFFAALFIAVGALKEVGVIEKAARWFLGWTQGKMMLAEMVILWVSALASAFVDNIPFVATMIPLIQDMGRLSGLPDLNLLWWSLALGSCLGGNGTIIGASANVIAVGMAEREGLHLGFTAYMKVAFPLMLMSVVLSTVYLLLRHFWPAESVAAVFLTAGLILALSAKPKMRAAGD